MIGVYIGAAIDAANGDVSAPFKRITSLLDEVLENYVAFNPYTAYCNASQAEEIAGEYLVNVNMFALRNADLAVFLINDDPSIGVPIEIYTCMEAKKKFVILYEATKNPGVYLKWMFRGGRGRLIDLRTPNKSDAPVMQLRSILTGWEMI